MSNQHEPPTQSGVELVRITIPLSASAWHPYTEEFIWASKVEGGKFRIENIPFFALSLSYHDVVEAQDKSGELNILDVFQRSGNSTFRCYMRKDRTDEDFRRCFKSLEKLGCTYERSPAVYALNIPSASDYWIAYAGLQEGELTKIWDFEEGHRGHSLE
jgi:hypothetical protein